MALQEKAMSASFKFSEQNSLAYIQQKNFSLKVDNLQFNKVALREEFGDIKFRRIVNKRHSQKVILFGDFKIWILRNGV